MSRTNQVGYFIVVCVLLQLNCDVPLELLKAAILLRRAQNAEIAIVKPSPSSEHYIEQHSDKTKATPDVTTPIRLSERDSDKSVLTSLAAVCRHWQVTFKTRSDVSRRQLCLMLHG